MADISRFKSLAERLLAHWGSPAIVSAKSGALNLLATTETANVMVYLKDRVTTVGETTVVHAVMSATPFPAEGATLTISGVAYDIATVEQKGVGTGHIVQLAVLHER
jgi:hypothetical protein